MWNLQHFNAFGVFLCRSNFLHLFPTEGHSEPSRIAFDGIHGKIPRDFLEVPLSLPPPEGEPVVLVDRGTIVSVLKEGLLGMHICFWPFFREKTRDFMVKDGISHRFGADKFFFWSVIIEHGADTVVPW